jgi:hypothetical protein
VIDCESIGEIRRKDLRREEPQKYWIYWKSIGNIRKRLPRENIKGEWIGTKFIAIYGRIISHAKNNKLLIDCKSVAATQRDLPV